MFFMSLDFQKSLGYNENTTKYGRIRPESFERHFVILIYQTENSEAIRMIPTFGRYEY